QGHQRRLLATRCAQEQIAIHERRLRVCPCARLAVEVGAEALLPARFPRAGFDASQVPVGSERIEEVSIHRGRGTSRGEVRLLLRVSGRAETRGPFFLAVLDANRRHELIVEPLVGQEEDVPSHNGGGRVAGSDVRLLPEKLWPSRGPLLEKARLLRDAVAV